MIIAPRRSRQAPHRERANPRRARLGSGGARNPRPLKSLSSRKITSHSGCSISHNYPITVNYPHAESLRTPFTPGSLATLLRCNRFSNQ